MHTYIVNTSLLALCYCGNIFIFKMICFAHFVEPNWYTCTMYLFLDVYVSRCISCLSDICKLCLFHFRALMSLFHIKTD